jgi:hypothetical protein
MIDNLFGLIETAITNADLKPEQPVAKVRQRRVKPDPMTRKVRRTNKAMAIVKLAVNRPEQYTFQQLCITATGGQYGGNAYRYLLDTGVLEYNKPPKAGRPKKGEKPATIRVGPIGWQKLYWLQTGAAMPALD